MVIIVIPAYVLALSSSIQPIEIEWNFRNYAIKPISICKKKTYKEKNLKRHLKAKTWVTLELRPSTAARGGRVRGNLWNHHTLAVIGRCSADHNRHMSMNGARS